MELQVYYPGTDPNIRVYGRTRMQNPLPLFWSASGIEFETDAADCYLEFQTGYESLEQWIRVEVNDYPVIRMALNPGTQRIPVFRGMAVSGVKKVRLFKEDQPMGQDPASFLLVSKVECDGKLLALAPLKYRIEFVGDSITSGEGMAGNERMQDWVASVFSNQGHYAVQIAKNLQADFHIVAQSGWGTYCSWDNRPKGNVPGIYDQVCGVFDAGPNVEFGCREEYDFEAWQPDVVVINLGTNDDGAFHNPAYTDPDTGILYQQQLTEDGSYEQESLERLRRAVKGFLKKLRVRNPGAYLIWAYGMIGEPLRPYLEQMIAQYQEETGDKRVCYQPLPDTRPEWLGARQHPGVPSHQAAAQALTETIRALLQDEKQNVEGK